MLCLLGHEVARPTLSACDKLNGMAYTSGWDTDTITLSEISIQECAVSHRHSTGARSLTLQSLSEIYSQKDDAKLYHEYRQSAQN